MFGWVKVLCAIIAFAGITAGAGGMAYVSHNHGGGWTNGGGGGGGGSAGAPAPIAGAGLPFLLIVGTYAFVRQRRLRTNP